MSSESPDRGRKPHRRSFPMDKTSRPEPPRFFKRNERPLNTLGKCTNCQLDLSHFELAPPNCPLCGKRTSTAPPLPYAGPGWGVDYYSSGGIMTHDFKPLGILQAFGKGAQADGNVFDDDGAGSVLGMDSLTWIEWQTRGTLLKIEQWRDRCGEEGCSGYVFSNEMLYRFGLTWQARDRARRDWKATSGRPRAAEFSFHRNQLLHILIQVRDKEYREASEVMSKGGSK